MLPTDVALSSDFIAGFCGETEADHQDTVSLIHDVQYNFAFCFPYSMRQVLFCLFIFLFCYYANNVIGCTYKNKQMAKTSIGDTKTYQQNAKCHCILFAENAWYGHSHIEGSRPEWCITSMIYSGDTPFWLETLDMQITLLLHFCVM